MSHAIDVHVLDADGDPVTGTAVRIDIEGLDGGTLDTYTNDEGHAEFKTAGDYPPDHEIRIRVRKQWFGPYEISGGAYTVTLE